MSARSIEPGTIGRSLIVFAALFLTSFSLSFAQEGERVVPIDKVVLGNRLNQPVNVFLLPDVGTYELRGGSVQEFACAIVKGFALSAEGTKFKAECGKRYTITQSSQGLEIVELMLNGDRP